MDPALLIPSPIKNSNREFKIQERETQIFIECIERDLGRGEEILAALSNLSSQLISIETCLSNSVINGCVLSSYPNVVMGIKGFYVSEIDSLGQSLSSLMFVSISVLILECLLMIAEIWWGT